MSDPVLTCVYCGHQYPDGTPAAKHQLLTEHIKKCEAHPLRAAEDKTSLLRKALADLVGADSREELIEMEAAMRLLPAPDQDKVVMLNAIHALQKTCD